MKLTIDAVAKDKCCGCTACYNICPKNAIKMNYDNEGFKYPKIDENLCTCCGLCHNICPSMNKNNNNSLNKCYAANNKCDDFRLTSSSGGIFDALARYILNKNGLVIGAAFDENNNLNHITVDHIEKLESIKGSKYLQSNLNDVFKEIKSQIKDKEILFVGTPCQVSGLKKFLNKDYENLYCCDIICHGVPSLKVFKKYLSELEERNGRIIDGINFRDKKLGWENYHISVNQEKENYYTNHSKDLYMRLFLSDICLRSSCYNCDFKLGNKYSDMTLGDFWGISNHYPNMNDKKGTSAIIINTDKGNKLFQQIKENLILKECDLNQILSGNPSLKYSSKRHSKREEFFKSLESDDSISKLSRKYLRDISLPKKICRKLKKILSK